VFDGLLPEAHNTILMELLFICAHWHGLAKLRMHTDLTLEILDQLTTNLGEALRRFDESVCSAYETWELPREAASRHRHNAKKVASTDNSNSKRGKAMTLSSRKVKHLNINTYKFHALGDYVDTIRQFGMTDSYSTEPVSHFLALHGWANVIWM
jgi:hypothetical protein